MIIRYTARTDTIKRISILLIYEVLNCICYRLIEYSTTFQRLLMVDIAT